MTARDSAAIAAEMLERPEQPPQVATAVAVRCLCRGVVLAGCGSFGTVIRQLPPLVAGQELLVAGGVTTTWAQHHGGPWPATSRPDASSVGAAALDRFTRPVTFQGAADCALPAPLQADNMWAVPRRVNGHLILGTPSNTKAATRAQRQS